MPLNGMPTWYHTNNWFRSYLEGRSYFGTIGSYESERVAMTCGIPQGSILVPLLFNLYMLPLGQILQNFNITVMQTIHNFMCLCHQMTAAQQTYCVSVWRK